MTKYVLNSGGIDLESPRGKEFIAEIVEGHGDNPKVLFCFFAQPREVWEEKFPEYEKGFKSTAGISLTCELAMPKTFEDQLRECDAVYLHGGDDHLMQYWLRQFDLPRIWEGKTVATNSASSHALSKYFWTCDWRQLMDGLGILPIKFIAHFNSSWGTDDPRGPIDWQKAYDELKAYKDADLPIHALPENEFVVIKS